MVINDAASIDLVLVHPSGRSGVYQQLGDRLAAIEPPLWCRLIAAHVRDGGHPVVIIDCEALELGPEALAVQIAARRPRLVAMVVFGHQPSASTQQMPAAASASRAIKRVAPSTPIIIVGGHVSALPERTLREEPVDFACVGEGFATIVRLLEILPRNQVGNTEQVELASVPGLVWRETDLWGEACARLNPSAALADDLDAVLHGNAWDLLPMTRYRAHNWQCFGDLARRQPYAAIYTSLGCPYRCHFCCIHAPFGSNRYRMRSPAAVVTEVDQLYCMYGVRTFKIVDELFVLNPTHVAAICDGLSGLGYADELNIWAYARVDTVKPETLLTLRRAGFRWLALGIESGSKLVRDGSGKALRRDEIAATVRQIQQAGICVIGNFIFGLPDDTLQTMHETLTLARQLNCEFANFYSAMAYPGSPLYATAIERGWALPDTWSDYSQHSFDCTPLPTDTLSAVDVLRFRDAAFHTFFSDDRYLEMIARRFGSDTRRHVAEMTRHHPRRQLLENGASPVELSE